MHKKFLLKTMSLIAIVAATTMSAQAFSSANYTRMSKLASGRWVKIEIPESGIYQLTFEELAQMGFSDPASVRIYGLGGFPINEILDGSQIDDLEQIPIKMYDNKICFYGCGPLKFTISTPTGTPHYMREFNSYSSKGYYFVTTDGNEDLVEPATVNSATVATPVARTHSLDYWHHEEELVSPAESGKDMMGEDMINAEIDVPYSIPTLCTDSMVVVNINAGAKVTAASYIKGKLNGNTLNFQNIAAKIYAPANSFVHYNYASPYVAFTPSEETPMLTDGNINVKITSEAGTVSSAWLDYVTITYFHNNSLEGAQDNQLRMGFRKLTKADVITLNNAEPSTQLWNIDDPHNPTICELSTGDNGAMVFAPNVTANMGQYIAFNPTNELKSISGYSEVSNQNIHGLPDPDMVIVTCEELMPQAERVAQMHRDNDNMVVHVIDQQKIFNEFSSGTPDAMGIRLMSKMFYDRNRNKYKHLLMFGAGNYDNRQLRAKRQCTILTYEASISNDEEYSFVSDDFFGLLDDNSGIEPAKDYLRLGVGRIPSATIQEAESDVDKLLEYVNNPDYGPWRNDIILTADDYDNGLHAFQAEGINNIIVDELATGLMNNKVYISQFPNDATGFAFEARKELTSKLKEGQYFMTYVGHGNPSYITKEVQLWGTDQSNNVDYPHMPILTTACCDVARYDCNQRGLVEIMFHKPDGGAIAIVTSARSVYATDNDALNQAFVKAMFCYGTKGYMPTVGEAYMLCKQSFGNKINNNKMSFFLLGDPAMKVNYPKPFFKITKINGTNVGTTAIASGAMQEVTVEAQVYNPDGTTVNTSFNGDATLSIYDYKKKETTITVRVNRVDVTRDIYFPQNLLTRVNGRVVNGVFTAKAVIPRYILSTGYNGMVKVYAHRDDSEEMVNGSFNLLKLNTYNDSDPLTVHDDMPPVIDAFYFNDEQSFSNGGLIPSGSTLYIRASDDHSFNNQAVAVGNTMTLQLDGGKTTYPYVKNFSTLEDEGRALSIEFPMDLQEGRHTLQYTVYDAAGNKASETISFLVGNESQLELTVDEEPAMTQATFNASTTLSSMPEVAIKVFDNVGNLVWNTTTASFPYTWNLNDNTGKRLPAGVYKFYGTYKGDNTYGGTEIGHLIIIDPYRSNEE